MTSILLQRFLNSYRRTVMLLGYPGQTLLSGTLLKWRLLRIVKAAEYALASCGIWGRSRDQFLAPSPYIFRGLTTMHILDRMFA